MRERKIEREREREGREAGRHRAGAGRKVIECIWEEVNERILRISPWNT